MLMMCPPTTRDTFYCFFFFGIYFVFLHTNGVWRNQFTWEYISVWTNTLTKKRERMCVKKSQGEDRSNFSFRSKRFFIEVVVGRSVLVAQKKNPFLSKMPNDINYTPKLVFFFHSKCVISILWTDSLCFAYVGFCNKGLDPVLSFTCLRSIFNYNLLQWHLLLVLLHFSMRFLSLCISFSCSYTSRDSNEISFNWIKCQCFDFNEKKKIIWN